MLVQFTVDADNSNWAIDTNLMSYLHTEGEGPEAKIVERGKIVLVGTNGPLRVFALEGRDIRTDGPGAGLCTFGYALVDIDTVLTFYIQANVKIRNINSLRPIDTIRYEVLPTPQELMEELKLNGRKEEESQGQEESTEQGIVSEGTSEKEPLPGEASIQSGS